MIAARGSSNYYLIIEDCPYLGNYADDPVLKERASDFMDTLITDIFTEGPSLG